MNCHSCGAAMHLDLEKTRWECDYCGQVVIPEPDMDGVATLGGSTGLECPVCQVELLHAAVVNAPLMTCPTCHGLLVAMDTFQGIVLELRAMRTGSVAPPRAIDARDLERRMECPRCHQAMDTHPYGGGGFVVIDNCPRCEWNWLDAGDLRRIVNAGAPARYDEETCLS